MYLKVLIIIIGVCVNAMNKEDVGDVPYENHVSSDLPGLSSTAVSIKDYGEISYEAMKFNDYGDIEYEKGKKSSVGEDYGDIPLEKESAPFNIPEMVKQLLGGREVPGMTKAGMKLLVSTSVTTSPSTPSTNLTSKPKPMLNVTAITEFTGTLDEIRMRAMEDEEFIGEHNPSTIDDSLCNPAKQKCSTCRDAKGYRVYCLAGTTTAAPQALHQLVNRLVQLTKDYEDYKTPKRLNYAAWNKYIKSKYPLGWPYCVTTSTTTPTPSPTDAPHRLVGRTIAQCIVCGMLESGIPQEDTMCTDSFMSRHYKKHCKFLNREGWYINGTAGYYIMWGRWTGGCAMRFADISPVYTQRTCRDRKYPAVGGHYVSRRMAKLEYFLRAEKDACVSSPTASLVPLSRGISLYSRFTACVCSKPYCNRAERLSMLTSWHTVVFSLITTLSNHLLW